MRIGITERQAKHSANMAEKPHYDAVWWEKKKDELLESHRAKGNGRRKK